MGGLIAVVLVTIFVSAQCSLFEAVLYSTRLSALEASKKQDHRKALAKRFMEMKRRISIPLGAILILNTVANTAGAALAGMYATQVLGASWVLLFSIGLTLGILFFSEILPKTLGAVYWRVVWPFVVWPLTLMQWILFPLVWITRIFSGLFMGKEEIHPVSEEEILATVHMGVTTGQITQDEKRLVHNIIELENNLLRDVMTPRTVMFMQEASKTVNEALPLVLREGFTRIPVFEGDRENIIGYVMIQDLVTVKERGGADKELKDLAKPITFVPRSVNCLTQLSVFLKQRSHVAIVVDEYGGVAGLVALEDVLETLLGTEIVDERDKEVDLQKKALRDVEIRMREAAGPEGNGVTKDEA